MSVVTDIVIVSNNNRTMEKVADLAGHFLSRRYSDWGSLKDFILNYNHEHYDEIQSGPKVGGANILWFTLNHQSSDDFVELLKEEGVTGVTLWIDFEYSETGPEIVQL